MTICDLTTIPGETECRVAIWSEGRECKTCHRSDCYRQGWEKQRVDADNRALVAKNHGGFEPQEIRLKPLRKKIIHQGHMMREDGAVSALCYVKLHPVDLKHANYVLFQPEAVTCNRCKQIMAASTVAPQEGAEQGS